LYRKTQELLDAQRDILERERRYSTLLENVHMIAVGLDTEGQINYANPFFLQITGYSAAEVLGKDWFDLFLTEGERGGVKEVFKSLNGNLSVSHYENRILTRTGEERLISWNNTVLLDPQGQFIGIMSLGTDMTEYHRKEEELRESEDKFKYVFDHSVIGKSITLPSGEVNVNQAFSDMLGYSAEEMRNRKWQDITHPDDIEATQKVINSLLSGEKDSVYFTKRYIHKSGKVVWGDVGTAIRRDKEGNPLYLMTAIRDITARKEAEEEILRLNEELEQRVRERTAELEASNKELEAFAYAVSHDLRAPLRSIDGFSNALLEDYLKKMDETGKNYLQRVRDAAQRMGFLIDDMLKLSKITRTEIEKELVDLSEMAESIAEAYRQSNPGRAFDLIIHRGITIKGDRHLMRIVMENLLDNAFKFTGRQEHPRIEFSRTIKDEEPVYYLRDNGVGFDMTYVNKLFGVFQRLHSSHEFTGTGVGLATVQRIINRHGGRVWAEGEVGKGATFYFTLPS